MESAWSYHTETVQIKKTTKTSRTQGKSYADVISKICNRVYQQIEVKRWGGSELLMYSLNSRVQFRNKAAFGEALNTLDENAMGRPLR